MGAPRELPHDREILGMLVGVPHRALGDGLDGADCIGLACLFWRLHGIVVPHPGSISYEDGRVLDSLRSVLRDDAPPPPRNGDLVIIRVAEPELVAPHVGIWTPDGVLHSLRRRPSVITPHRAIRRLIEGSHRLKCLC